MTQTSGSHYVPGYDLFKLIVAIILTIIFILLLLHGCQPTPVPATVTPTSASVTESVTPPPPTDTVTPTSATATETLTPPPLTATATIKPVTATFTAQPPPTNTPTPSPTFTPTPNPTSDPNACPSAPSRIRAGDTVRVLYRLNFRTGPGLNWPIILTNNAGTRMNVIGGPFCTPRDTPEGTRAYLWWNVRMQDGREGWSAEASLINPHYFLEPIR